MLNGILIFSNFSLCIKIKLFVYWKYVFKIYLYTYVNNILKWSVTFCNVSQSEPCKNVDNFVNDTFVLHAFFHLCYLRKFQQLPFCILRKNISLEILNCWLLLFFTLLYFILLLLKRIKHYQIFLNGHSLFYDPLIYHF